MQKLIIALVILSLISGENCIIGTDLRQLLKAYVPLDEFTYPLNYLDYIQHLYSGGHMFAGIIPKSQSWLLQRKYRLPEDVVNSFVMWHQAQMTTPLSFKFISNHNKAYIQYYIGAAIIEGDNYRYAIIVAYAGGSIIPKEEKYVERKCKGWWIFRKCWNETKTRTRQPTFGELDIVTRSIKARLFEATRAQIDRNDDDKNDDVETENVSKGDELEPEQSINFLA